MALTSFNLQQALLDCPASGITPSELSEYYIKEIQHEHQVTLELSKGLTVTFLQHTFEDKIVLTATNVLTYGFDYGVYVDKLPEILECLGRLGISNCVAIQFPIGLRVQGRLSEATYRAHFNQLLIYKDSNHNLNAVIIDSTFNPIGVHNPITSYAQHYLPTFMTQMLPTTSVISGQELLQSRIEGLLTSKPVATRLQQLFAVVQSNIEINYPILSGIQPSIGDKRCGVFVVNAMTHLINYMLSAANITYNGVSDAITIAHAELDSGMAPVSLAQHAGFR